MGWSALMPKVVFSFACQIKPSCNTGLLLQVFAAVRPNQGNYTLPQHIWCHDRTATGRKASRHRSRAHRETPLGPAPGRGPLRDSPLATPTHRLTNPDKDKKRMDLRFAAKEPGEAQSRGVPRRCGAAPFPPGTVYPSRARRGRRGGSRAGPAGPARPAPDFPGAPREAH